MDIRMSLLGVILVAISVDAKTNCIKCPISDKLYGKIGDKYFDRSKGDDNVEVTCDHGFDYDMCLTIEASCKVTNSEGEGDATFRSKGCGYKESDYGFRGVAKSKLADTCRESNVNATVSYSDWKITYEVDKSDNKWKVECGGSGATCGMSTLIVLLLAFYQGF